MCLFKWNVGQHLSIHEQLLKVTYFENIAVVIYRYIQQSANILKGQRYKTSNILKQKHQAQTEPDDFNIVITNINEGKHI